MYKQDSTPINVALVYMLLFVSGAHRYNLSQDTFIVVAFLVALSAWYFLTERKISGQYLLYLTVFVGLLFFLSIYTGGSLSLQSLIKTTMKFVLAYLVLRTVGDRFVETYVNVIVFLAAVSIAGYLTDLYQLFDPVIYRLPAVGQYGYEGFLYIFRHLYHPERNNSIFFEPGAYQGFLNSAIFLLLFAENGFSKRRIWLYISVLAVALATASSTTGFIIFTLIFLLFLFKSDLATRSQKTVAVGTIAVVVMVFAAQFHDALVVKLDDYLNPDPMRKGYSAENRSFDLQTDLEIIKNHVFGLGYDEYKKEFSRVNRVSIREGSSNGVTSMLANYGVPYGLFILGSYFWALRKLTGDFVLAGAAYTMFIMFLWGESYYQIAPVCFAIIAAPFVYSPLHAGGERRQAIQDRQQGGAA